MTNARLTDITLHYNVYETEAETEETILLIHGAGLDSTLWDLLLPGLTREYRVVTFDLRGCGKSEDGDLPPTWDVFCNDILQLITYLKLPAVHLVGNSFGASLSIKFSTRYPGYVKSLVLISSVSIYPKAIAEKTAELYFKKVEEFGLVATIEKDIIPPTTTLPPGHPELKKIVRSFSRMKLDFYLNMFGLLVADRPIDELSLVEHPTLLLAGEFDSIYVPSMQAITANHIRNSTFYIVPNASNLVFLDQPAITANWIVQFLNRQRTPLQLAMFKPELYAEFTQTIKQMFDEQSYSQDSSILQVDLLHTFRVTVNGSPRLEGWNRRYAKNLLAYLLFHPGCTREQICDDLFPMISYTDALRNLKVYLNHLRKLLQPDVGSASDSLLHSDRQHLTLRGRIYSDLLDFRSSVRACRNEADPIVKELLVAQIMDLVPTTGWMTGLYDDWYLQMKHGLEMELEELARWTLSRVQSGPLASAAARTLDLLSFGAHT